MKKHSIHEGRLPLILCMAAVLLLLSFVLVACKTNPTPGEETTGIADTTEEPAGETQEPTTPPHETTAETEPETQPEVLGVANVAVGCPAIVNAGEEQGGNLYLTDGDLKAGFLSHRTANKVTEEYPYEIVVDLITPQSLKKLAVFKGNRAACFYGEFRVELSNDGLTYTLAGTQAEAVMGSKGFEMELSETARFVRITSTGMGEREDYRLSIGEIEIYGEVTTANNLVASKRELAMCPGATELLTATPRMGAKKTLTYTSSDTGIITVDAETGLITALADGQATVYVTDGYNRTAVPVTVRAKTPEYHISAFYLSDHGINSRETFALLKEAGIMILESFRPYDSFGNLTTDYIRLQAQDYGMRVNIADTIHGPALLKLSDEEIRAIVAKYKNLPAYDGMYLLDEPLNANDYARVYKAMLAEDPFGNHHLNLLPGGMSDFHGYVSDWVACVGGDNLKYLTYDNYPFGVTAGSFNAGVYNTMNEIRKTGLLYGVNTGYYLQAMGIVGAYRVPNDAELLYHASLGVAYGMKDFKWFVWFTPPYRGSGEHFTTGILNSDMEKSEMFEGVKAANAMIRTLSPLLSNTDAVELYHTNQEGTPLPDKFCVTPDRKSNIILSVMVDRESGQQYLCIVNKNMVKEIQLPMSFRDGGPEALWNVTTGEAVPVTLSQGSFSVDIPAGGLCVLKLPEGYDARFDTAVEPMESLLVGHGASVSSSQGGAGHFAYKLTDGDRKGTSWVTKDPKADSAWVIYDLKKPTEFNRMDIYPAGDDYVLGLQFPKALSIWVSDDGVSYTKLAEKTDIRMETWGSITFEQVKARYVKVSLDTLNSLTGEFCAELGEIELYLDKGQIPPMPAMEVKPRDPSTDANIALGMRPIVSSSYEEWGWTQSSLCDGRSAQGSDQGWCSAIGSQTPDNPESVLFPFGSSTTVSKVVIYPAYEHFVSDYSIEVSQDGVNWTTVASVTGERLVTPEPRVLIFDPVETKFLRLSITKMWNKSGNAAVGYVVQIREIEIYADKDGGSSSPSTDIPQYTPQDPSDEANIALGMKPIVSSSYEEWGWTRSSLCDGRSAQGSDQGWCSAIGSQTPDNPESVLFPFSRPVKMSKVVIYPAYEHFVSDYSIEVSQDGVNWTTVASVTGERLVTPEPRVLTFDTVETKFLRLSITKMWNKSGNAAVGYVVQIREIELYA